MESNNDMHRAKDFVVCSANNYFNDGHIESECFLIHKHLRGVKAWGSKQIPPIFENSNLEYKAFRDVTGPVKTIEELDYDPKNHNQHKSDNELSSDVYESEPMDTNEVEFNNYGALNIASSVLIITLPSTNNTRIVACRIPTSSTVIRKI